MALAEATPVAVIGGAAAVYHGYPRATKAIEVVVAAEDLPILLRRCRRYGFRVAAAAADGRSELAYRRVAIEVSPGAPSGVPGPPEALPRPEALGVTSGLGF